MTENFPEAPLFCRHSVELLQKRGFKKGLCWKKATCAGMLFWEVWLLWKQTESGRKDRASRGKYSPLAAGQRSRLSLVSFHVQPKSTATAVQASLLLSLCLIFEHFSSFFSSAASSKCLQMTLSASWQYVSCGLSFVQWQITVTTVTFSSVVFNRHDYSSRAGVIVPQGFNVRPFYLSPVPRLYLWQMLEIKMILSRFCLNAFYFLIDINLTGNYTEISTAVARRVIGSAPGSH